MRLVRVRRASRLGGGGQGGGAGAALREAAGEPHKARGNRGETASGAGVQSGDKEKLKRQGRARLSPGKRKLPEKLLEEAGEEPGVVGGSAQVYITCLINNSDTSGHLS